MKKRIMITINRISKTVLLRCFMLLSFLFFTFCQDGDEVMVQDTNEAVTKDSQAVFLMKSAVTDDSNDGKCLEYKYPISLYVYYPRSKSIETIVINSDEELFETFEQLANVDQISIDFPFVLLDSNDEETIIHDLTVLQETLTVAIDACSGSSDFEFCDNNNKKVNICHNGNTICVSVNAVQAHLEHGDVPGQCN